MAPTQTASARTAAEIVDLMARSHLLAAPIIRKLRGQLPPAGQKGAAANEFLRTLMRQRVITAYHSKCLLEGRDDGFFIGKYRILDMLGVGGMGQVYLAEQTSMKRAVALKVLTKIGDAATLARFRREARAVAKLRHPNIAQAHDFDEANGTHFFAMEYVAGLNLEQLVKRSGRLGVGQACDLIRQAAMGLQAAHAAKFVHRDIKPANLMLEPDGTVKVLDLGLVVSTNAGAASVTMAQQGAVLGTADYIAPEQARDSHAVDIRSDIYALGCVLYFLLSGRVPFPGTSLAKKFVLHQTKDPQPVRELAPEVPEGVAEVLAKMIRKDPAGRHREPRHVVEALAEFCEPKSPAYDAEALIKYPPAVVEEYLKYGGAAPAGSTAVMPRSTPPAGEADTFVESAQAGGTGKLTGTKKPKRKKSRKPAPKKSGMWIGVAVGVAAFLVAIGFSTYWLFGDDKLGDVIPPKEPMAKAPTGDSSKNKGRGESDTRTVRFSDKRTHRRTSGYTITESSTTDRRPLLVTGPDGGTATMVRAFDGPLFRIRNRSGVHLRNLIIDGGGKPGPVIHLSGKCPGLFLENVTVRNFVGDAVLIAGADGTADSPIRLDRCRFHRAIKGRSLMTSGVRLCASRKSRKASHVEITRCSFESTRAGLDVNQATAGLTVKGCKFDGVSYGVRFAAEPAGRASLKPTGVTGWRVAGWYPTDAVPEIDPARPPQKDWGTDSGTDPVVDLSSLFGPQPGAALGYAEVYSEFAGPRRLFIGADDEATLWVNGEKAFEVRSHQAHSPEFTCLVNLQAGVNRLWVRSINGESAGAFSVWLCDGAPRLTPAVWADVSLRDNEFFGTHIPVVFRDAPAAGSSVAVAGNRFVRSKHWPILVSGPADAVKPSNNVDEGSNHHELRDNDRRAFTLVPLN